MVAQSQILQTLFLANLPMSICNNVVAMAERSPSSNQNTKSLLKASWMRSSVVLAIIAAISTLVLIWLLKAFNVGGWQLFSDMEAFFLNYGLAGIFLATIAAGTIIPLGSPALVVAAALFGVNPILLVLIATTGFTIGMAINYSLANRLGRPYVIKRISAEHIEEMTDAWNRWGWTIYIVFGLIPVLPVEFLSFICGFLKTRVITFLALSFIPRLIIFSILVYFGNSVAIWLGVA
jgi:membrane protein YqaA with SNARE-associated domain